MQHDESLEDMRVGKVLLRRELGPLCRSDPDGRLVRDEARDPARLSGLADNVHSLIGAEQSVGEGESQRAGREAVGEG